MNLVTRQTCRICHSSSLTPILSLGDQYLGSTFVHPDESNLVQRPIPLELVRCNPQVDEGACGLVQLKHTVPPDLMYSSYWYESGVNRTMTEHLGEIASIEQQMELGPDDCVLDIGCNDGTLLSSYKGGFKKIGFEPSNISAVAESKGHSVIQQLFNAQAFEHRFPEHRPKLITSIAMFYDLENPHQFVGDIAKLLHADGIWIAEQSYLPLMLKTNSFDTICHEHLEYYHLAPIEILLQAHGLKIVDVELNDTNGGSFRFYARHAHHGEFSGEAKGRLAKLRKEEFELGFDSGAPFAAFERKCEAVRTQLNELINKNISMHKKIYLYGASTKGNTLLQYCGIGKDRVVAAVERNPKKVGLKTPGTNIPIISEEQAREENPDYMLVLPWHFQEEFIQREAEYLRRGGKLIFPLPEIRVIDQNDLE